MNDLTAALINFAIRFGINAAIAFAERLNKPAPTLDDAIAALKAARDKSADDYLQEARDKLKNV